MLLAKRYELMNDSLCAKDATGVGTFEDIDCTSLLHEEPLETNIVSNSKLMVTRDGTFSGLALYIVLQSEFDSSMLNRFPRSKYGDDLYKGKHVLWTTSNCMDNNSAVSKNWMNPILLLPTPVKVNTGKEIELKVTANLSDTTPSYRVECKYDNKHCADIHLCFADIYPNFKKLDAKRGVKVPRTS